MERAGAQTALRMHLVTVGVEVSAGRPYGSLGDAPK